MKEQLYAQLTLYFSAQIRNGLLPIYIYLNLLKFYFVIHHFKMVTKHASKIYLNREVCVVVVEYETKPSYYYHLPHLLF